VSRDPFLISHSVEKVQSSVFEKGHMGSFRVDRSFSRSPYPLCELCMALYAGPTSCVNSTFLRESGSSVRPSLPPVARGKPLVRCVRQTVKDGARSKANDGRKERKIKRLLVV
jgi:hypothetical protein